MHWLPDPWAWLVPLLLFFGIPLAVASAIVFRMRHRKAILEPDSLSTPEAPQEQTTITPASGHVIDPEAARVIGNPLLRWGKPERRRYVPDDYDGDIACLLCQRDILPGQFFWETPLINRETGEEIDTSFQLCLSCQPGDVAAVIHRDA